MIVNYFPYLPLPFMATKKHFLTAMNGKGNGNTMSDDSVTMMDEV
jgi:hypothetical protein